MRCRACHLTHHHFPLSDAARHYVQRMLPRMVTADVCSFHAFSNKKRVHRLRAAGPHCQPAALCRHKFFNTNNLWVNLDKLAATIEANGGLLKLPLIKNKKTVNPRDSDSTPVRGLQAQSAKVVWM